MSFLKRLFGGGQAAAAHEAATVTAEAEHGGFTIRAAPYRSEDGQYQTAGTIVATIDGEPREHAFVRADRFASRDDASTFSLQKGRQIVDEQGKTLFARRPSASELGQTAPPSSS